jgi:hypothetical protein
MKTSTMGIVSAAILMVVAGVGIGIAQAGGNRSYDPMLSFGDQDVSPSLNMANAREAVEWRADEFVPEGNWAGTDWQVRGSVETGAIPEMAPEESWMKEYGND